MKLPYLLLLVLPNAALADGKEYCRSAAEMRQSVVYCDQNFDYYEAARSCKDTYLRHMKKERKRIEGVIAAQAALATKSAQKEKMQHSSQVLASTIGDLAALIQYGKDVHTELEDYVYDLILPAMNAEEARADIDNPQVLAEFMRRECYGDPRTQIELMEKELQPVIEDLEKAMVKAVALKSATEANTGNLDSFSKGANTDGVSSGPAPHKPKPQKGKRRSDISGTEDKKE